MTKAEQAERAEAIEQLRNRTGEDPPQSPTLHHRDWVELFPIKGDQTP